MLFIFYIFFYKYYLSINIYNKIIKIKMSISGYINELNELNIEIKRLNIKIKELKLRATKINNIIQETLIEKDLPGVKYKGNAYLLEKKIKKIPKKKSQLENDYIELLENAGVENPQQVYNQLIDLKNGETKEINKLKIKKIK